jgi:hypothetical protein
LRRKFESVHNTRWRISNFRGQGYVLQRIGVPINLAVRAQAAVDEPDSGKDPAAASQSS